MGLSCDYDYEPESGDIVWYFPDKIAPMVGRKRSAKCCSCGAKIAPGSLAAEWVRAMYVDRANGGSDEIPRASWFQCATCGNIALFLRGFNYSFQPEDDMRELAAEHANEAMRGKATGCL